MAEVANGTVVAQDGYISTGTPKFEKATCYVGKDGKSYNVCCVKIKMPAFSGKINKLTVNLAMKKITSSNPTFRYALCSSVDNFTNYRYTEQDVEDSSQMAVGYQAFMLGDAYSIYSIEIKVKGLESEQEYFLYLWAYSSQSGVTCIGPTNMHSVVVTFKKSGGVRIRVSEENKLHVAVIYTNGVWKRYVPVVWNGSAWKRQG